MKTKKPNDKIDFIFMLWEIDSEAWDSLPWWEKLRAIVYFRIIMPKSKLVISKRSK